VSELQRRARSELERLDGEGLRRTIRPPCGVDFASNDYLGLRRDPRVVAAARTALEEEGPGAGAARLLRGDHPSHSALEARLAEAQGMEDGLLFSSGYLANLGVLQALAPGDWTILSDARNHASIIEGCRAAKARVEVVSHNDVAAFSAAAGERTMLVTESVFSMTGDRAPLEALGRLESTLVVDEAHALGLFAPAGNATLRVNPCGKALTSAGAVVTGPRDLLDLLRSTCRTFLFTTAPPPSASAAALAAFDIASNEPERGERALALARRVDAAAESCILFLRCADNAHALACQQRLFEIGLDVRAVRPPTVPRAGLRVSIHSDRTDAEVERLRNALGELGLLR